MIKQYPIPHVVINNFLGTLDNKSVLNHIGSLVPKMTQSTIIDHGVERIESSIKSNKNLWLDIFDDDSMQLCGYFSKYFFNSSFLSIIESQPELMHINGSSTRSHNALLSKYQVDDFYDWHVDVGGHVTWNYVCCDDFVIGGEFVLSDAEYEQDRNNEIKVPCQNDTLIIFPAKYQHKVEPIESGCRYSIQIFFS
jgi:hypothetical protein